MRQKYCISQVGNDLIIKEYAIIDREMKNLKTSMLVDGDYVMMCQENYEGKAIKKAISNGMDALITILRTANMFPIQPYACKIAESVIAIYSSDDRSADLFFDDLVEVACEESF
jgi:hypothetical protein